MKIAKIVCLLIMVFTGCFSCKNHYVYRQTSSGSVTQLLIDRQRAGIDGAELFDSLRFIQLETTPESMFDYIRCLRTMNGKFYLLDRMGTKLLCFDKDGKFLKKVEARGKGPNEYFMLCFLAVDPVSKKILVADDVVRKIFIYDEFLNLEHVVKTDFSPKQVIAFRDNMILRYENESKEQYQDSLLRDYDLHWIDLDGKVVQGLIKNKIS